MAARLPRPPVATVVGLHAFTRSPAHLSRLAEACRSAGLGWVAPSLAPRWLPTRYMNRRRLERLSARLAGALPGQPLVVVGHSAGAAAGCYLATALLRRGVQVCGVVLVDGVDSPNHLIERSLPGLEQVPIAAVLAPPSRCNRDGALARLLAGRPRIRVTLVEGAGHGDIEGAGIAAYRRWCGDTSDDRLAEVTLTAVMGAVEEMAIGRAD